MKKIFVKWMNNAVFGKTVENVRKHEILNLLQQKEAETIWCHPNYHTAMFFTEHLLAIEMKKKTGCLFRTFNTRIK